MEVNNEGVRRQFQSMVYQQWDKDYFRPKIYYWLVHNKYRRGEDRRYILQLAPTIASSTLNNQTTEEENKEVEKDYTDEIAIDLDKRVNLKYDLLYRKEFDGLFLRLSTFEIRASFEVLSSYSGQPFNMGEHNQVVLNFIERKKIIDDSYQESYKKNRAYDQLLSDMENYLKLLINLERRLAVYNKYTPLIKQIKD